MIFRSNASNVTMHSIVVDMFNLSPIMEVLLAWRNSVDPDVIKQKSFIIDLQDFRIKEVINIANEVRKHSFGVFTHKECHHLEVFRSKEEQQKYFDQQKT